MEPGGTWERLLQTPTTWIVVAAVLFVVAVVLLVAGAVAGRRARREQRAAAAGPAEATGPVEEDPVTEPAAPGRAPETPVRAPSGDTAGEPTGDPAEEEPVTEPAVPRGTPSATGHPPAWASTPTAKPGSPRTSDPAAHRLLGALVGDPNGALAGVAALERGEEPGRAAVTLLRSGVPAPAVARLCGVAADDLGDLVATTLGILPTEAEAVVDRTAAPAPAG
jgi:hypothetical protein